MHNWAVDFIILKSYKLVWEPKIWIAPIQNKSGTPQSISLRCQET